MSELLRGGVMTHNKSNELRRNIWAVAKIQVLQNGIFFFLRFKGPLRFSMFGTRLSFKQFWLCQFLNGLRDVGCRAPFWKPCTFACVPARLYSICFRPSVAFRYSSRWKGLHVSTSGWMVFLILRLTRDCIFFPGKAHAANYRSASSSLVRMDWI